MISSKGGGYKNVFSKQQQQQQMENKDESSPSTVVVLNDAFKEIERKSKLYHFRVSELSNLILQGGEELERHHQQSHSQQHRQSSSNNNGYQMSKHNIEMDKRIRELATEFPSIFQKNYKFRYGGLAVCKPLKAVCILRASTKTIKAVYRAYPDAILKDHHPHLDPPIHWACHVRLQRKAIEFLLVKCPESLLKKATYGKTPLHIACGALDVNVARCLLQICPQAAMETDDFDNTPLHLSLLQMKDRAERKTKAEDDQEFARLIVDLIKAAPMAAKMRFRKVLLMGITTTSSMMMPTTQSSSCGAPLSSLDRSNVVLPLQVALEYIPPNNTATVYTNIIQELLIAYPEAPALNEDIILMGWRRRHLWERRLLLVAYHLCYATPLGLQSMEYTQLFPLHAIIQCSHHRCDFDSNMLMESFDYFHDRLIHFDNIFGCLPLHLLLSRIQIVSSTTNTTTTNSKQMVSTLLESVLYLVQREPRVVHVRDPYTGFFPFMMVATMKLHNSNTILLPQQHQQQLPSKAQLLPQDNVLNNDHNFFIGNENEDDNVDNNENDIIHLQLLELIYRMLLDEPHALVAGAVHMIRQHQLATKRTMANCCSIL